MNKNKPDSNVDPPPALEKGTLHGLGDFFIFTGKLVLVSPPPPSANTPSTGGVKWHSLEVRGFHYESFFLDDRSMIARTPTSGRGRPLNVTVSSGSGENEQINRRIEEGNRLGEREMGGK